MIDIVCAGHVCLDLTPRFPERGLTPKDIFVAGKQSDVGAMVFSPGGSASNTGAALNRLGIFTPIMGRVGDDTIGKLIPSQLRDIGGTGQYLHTVKGDETSYTVVLAVPGSDRIFLHNPGSNDNFTSDDIDFDIVAQTKLFHFGYPPLMRQMYINEGEELLYIMKHSKELGATTSLDMAQPDGTSEAAAQDWNVILKKVLPYTDIYLPSIEELLLLLDRKHYDELKSKDDDILANLTLDKVEELADKLIGYGAGIVVIKCGTMGLFMQTSGEKALARMGRAKLNNIEEWTNKTLYSGIYKVDDVKSATGSGDSSIAGFLAGIINQFSPEETLSLAGAVGAFSVTDYSAVGGIEPLEKVIEKIKSGWEKRPVGMTCCYGYLGDTQVYCK